MNKLAMTLIAAVILFASPVSAEDKPKQTKLGDLDCSTNQIVKFSGTEWVCADDETGSAGDSGPVLVDSTGVQIGPVLLITNAQQAAIELEVGGTKWLIDVNYFGFFAGGPGANPVFGYYHQSTDCSGAAYLPRGVVDPSNTYNQSLFGFPYARVYGTLETPRIYSAGPAAVPQTITAQSRVDAGFGGPVCNQLASQSVEVYDILYLDTLDLSGFVPPFRIESQQ